MSGIFAMIRVRLADRAYKRKLFHTLGICYCYIAVGMVLSQTGPALLDLQLITNTNTQQASLFITVAAVGSIVGSIAMGYLFGRWNKVLILSAVSLALGITDIALPWCSIYGLMIFMHGIVAMFRSSFSTAATVDVIRTWAPNSRVFIQILNTCFSLGGALAPLITQPFLKPRSSGNITNVSENSTSQDPLSQMSVAEDSETTHVQFAYLIHGVWFLVGSIIFLVERFQPEVEDESTLLPDDYESLEKPLPTSVYIGTLIFIFFMFFFLIALQTSLASFLLTFAVTYLNWTKANGASLTTDYWLCHASGRFISIFFTKYVSPFKCLLVGSTITLLATIGNVFSSLNQYDLGVWLCTGIIGLCASSQVPSLMLWTEESMMRLTPRVVSVFNLSISFPAIVIPQIVGYLMQDVSPMWLLYLNVVQTGALLVLLLLTYLWARIMILPTHGNVTYPSSLKGDIASNSLGV